MYYVYILKSKLIDKTYIGITDDIERRLSQHNTGYSIFTRRYKPWIILYSYSYKNRHDAHIQEKYLKSASGRRWIKKTLFNNKT